MYQIGYKNNVFYSIQLCVDKHKTLVDLGNRVKMARTSKGLTQMELAHRLGKDHPSINRLENGKINPSFFFLCEVAQGLEMELHELINYCDQK